MIRAKTGYFDSNGREYELGDLVYNPMFGDVWLVDEWDENEARDAGDSPYCLRQYCSKEIYCIDIDDPDGFVIEARRGDEHYDELYRQCEEYARKWLEEESE